MENKEPQLTPELLDITNRVHAFNVTNPDAIFLFGFIGFKKDGEICDECGGDCNCVDQNKLKFGGFGDLESLRQLSNDLRDYVEDNVDRQGFVMF